jgi:signal transduction histidine kinase
MTVGSNLSLRITALLLIGFVLFQMAIVVTMALPSRGNDRRPYNLPLPEQVRTMVDMLDPAPPERRATLIDMFNSSLYTIAIRHDPLAPLPSRRKGLDQLERQYDAALPGHVVDIAGRQPLLDRIAGKGPWPGRFFAPIFITVRLKGGDLLVIDSRPSALVRSWLRERSLLGAIGGLIVLAVLALAVRQTTQPLVRLSRGVRGLSRDLDTPDLPVSGSREMRELSVAFNEMKARIGGLLSERTRMLAGIAHDMRTYLTRLRLRADFIDDADQRTRAIADLDEMAALLDDTLLFARRDADADADADAEAAPKPQRIDVAAELAAITALRSDMGEAVELLPVPIDLTIQATPIALRRMLANLIDNGLRHGGQVTLSAGECEGGVKITVADNGPGVPEAALSRLGEPFCRIDPSRDRSTGGAGLGLAIVRALAERDGAAVSFANRAGGGFVATLTFRR